MWNEIKSLKKKIVFATILLFITRRKKGPFLFIQKKRDPFFSFRKNGTLSFHSESIPEENHKMEDKKDSNIQRKMLLKNNTEKWKCERKIRKELDTEKMEIGRSFVP